MRYRVEFETTLTAVIFIDADSEEEVREMTENTRYSDLELEDPGTTPVVVDISEA
jgi:hypothetical protein